MRGVPVAVALCLLSITPLVGSAATPRGDDVIAWAVREMERGRGIDLPEDEMVTFASVDFVLPSDASGVSATMDWATGELSVGPSGHEFFAANGCIIPPYAVVRTGWTQPGVVIGTSWDACRFRTIQGGVDHQLLACSGAGPNTNAQCLIDTMDARLGTFAVEFFVLACSYTGTVVHSRDYGEGTEQTIGPAGTCAVGGRLFSNPRFWFAYDSMVSGSPATLVAGLNNWKCLLTPCLAL